MREYAAKWWLVGFTFTLFIFFLALPMAGEGSAKEGVIKWDYSPAAPATPGSAYDKYTKAPFADIIARDTNGKLNLVVHEQLVPAPKVIDALRDGTVNMGCQIILFRAEMALLNFAALPFVPDSRLPDMRSGLRPIFREQVDKEHDAVLLGYGYWAQQRLITKKPIRSLADLKGYKIRVHNKELQGMMQAAGAIPIFIRMAEVYPALQRGVVDGAVSSFEGMYGNKFHEVAKYVSNWPLGNAAYIWVANKPSWKALPSDLQERLLRLFEDKYEMATYYGGLQDDAELMARMKKEGVSFFDPSAEDKEKYLAHTPVILDQWKERAGPRAAQVLSVINKVLGTNY